MPYFYKVDAKNKQGYKWVCVADGPPDPVTGKRNQISRRADKKKDAENRVNKAIEDLLDAGAEHPKALRNMTFEKAAWEWLETYSKGRRKGSTIRVREKEIKILLRYVAAVNIDKVTHKMYQRILNDLDDKNYAKTSIEGVHVTAGMIFKYAIHHKMRKDNPCEGAVIPVKKLTVEEIENNTIEEKYLEKSELTEFLSVVREYGMPDDFEIFYLLAFSGMRSGELCALKETDFNFETNEMRITKTLYNPDNNMRKYELTPPKTEGSIRTIELDESIMDLIKAHIKKEAKKRMSTRHLFEDYHDKQFVFRHENGYPIIPKNINIRMQRLLKKTSIKKAATPHIFRHSHISMLTEAEVDINAIMKRVGHDDMKTTMQIYTHVTEKMRKSVTQKIKNHFGSILNM
ncbi:tyrosine-type recombinase/integrase [Paenibacillus sp. TAB 01]|uniref:tyrosine-type recombinase/integrase n=1 Tax=Paenibacillus sp. TAB 01 TaxID=3368988 RepID=UPI003753C9E9